MSNKHFVKRMRRLARRAGLGRGMCTIKDLYDAARNTERKQRQERTRQVNLAYAAKAKDNEIAGQDSTRSTAITQRAKRRAS